MKVVHWVNLNGSGMSNMATDISNAEREKGIASLVARTDHPEDFALAEGADIHVVHTHLPIKIDRKKAKQVWVAHGTPEHVFQSAVEKGISQGNYAPDPFMMSLYRIQTSDAIVTFWERQAAIWKTLADERTKPHIHCIPMGVDKRFWKRIPTQTRYMGKPTMMSAENCHFMKWPLDIVLALPWVAEEVPDVRLHMWYVPYDQHRWWFPLMFRNGTAYISYTTATFMSHAVLRDLLCSFDFYINPARYGDHNRIGLEAKACGCKVISFSNNPYSDFWLTEGDQRTIASEMIRICKGETEPRTPLDVPDISETAQAMIGIYEGL